MNCSLYFFSNSILVSSIASISLYISLNTNLAAIFEYLGSLSILALSEKIISLFISLVAIPSYIAFLTSLYIVFLSSVFSLSNVFNIPSISF